MSAVVVEDRLNVVGLYAKLAKLSRTGSTKVMQAPRRNPNAQINSCLAAIPVVEAPLSKDEVGAIAPGLAGEDGQGLRRQGQRELSPVLYPVRRQYDLLLCKINLLPLQPANLAA